MHTIPGPLAIPAFALALAAASVGLPAHAGGLNDTGITQFADDSAADLKTEPSTHPRQDASQGRDAAAMAGTLTKVGGGRAGFDFTKVANDGSVLPASAALGTGATDWGCTYDNVTGLLWEVKVAGATHLRYVGWSYSWYDSDPATNGGATGEASQGQCLTAGRCDTEKYVADVNATRMCGHADWRMPTVKELQSILDLSVRDPGPIIDTAYFPNTPVNGQFQDYSGQFWSRSSFARVPRSGAWYVNAGSGDIYLDFKPNAFSVRLVRTGR